jgi:Potato inhibitor I family
MSASAFLAGLAAQTKMEWPELVGKPEAEAIRVVSSERPDIPTVVAVPHTTEEGTEVNIGRVRLFVKDGLVDTVPKIG